jgi:hypothetical protein
MALRFQRHEKSTDTALDGHLGRQRQKLRSDPQSTVSDPDVTILDPAPFRLHRNSETSDTGIRQLCQEEKPIWTGGDCREISTAGNRMIADPLSSLEDANIKGEATRQKRPHDPAIPAQILEETEPCGEEEREPLRCQIDPLG